MEEFSKTFFQILEKPWLGLIFVLFFVSKSFQNLVSAEHIILLFNPRARHLKRMEEDIQRDHVPESLKKLLLDERNRIIVKRNFSINMEPSLLNKIYLHIGDAEGKISMEHLRRIKPHIKHNETRAYIDFSTADKVVYIITIILTTIMFLCTLYLSVAILLEGFLMTIVGFPIPLGALWLTKSVADPMIGYQLAKRYQSVLGSKPE